MKRREFITLIGGAAAAWPLAVHAQQAGKLPRVGYLGNSTAALEANWSARSEMACATSATKKAANIVIEYRWAEGNYDRFPALIGELLTQKVDVIVTAGTPATLAVKQATSSVPLVMVAVGDPISTGIVASFARPGGNITGLTSISPELEAKRLELLKEVVPNLAHFAVLWNPSNLYQVYSEKEIQALALVLGLRMLSLGVRSQEEIENAFGTIVKERPGALLVLADRLFLHNRARIMDFALQNRLPGVHAYRELAEAGGLMSFGPSYADMHRRAASYVDRILKGSKPADLPVEIPVKFTLVLNLKAAKAMGVTIPPTIIVRADEVIE
jgi:ABC-type uncharacterized transport system substrate-binding protein